MKLKIFIILILCMPMVMASICEDRLDNGSSCIMVTPEIICLNYTYNIHLDNGTPIIVNGTLNQLEGRKYYFNFSNYSNDYIITLCDGTTRQIRVTESYDTKFGLEERARMNIAIVISLISGLVFFLYLYYFINKEFKGEYIEWIKPVKFIFLMLAFLMMMGIFRLGIDLLTTSGNTSFASVFNTLWIILLIIYWLVFFIVMFLFGVRFMMSLLYKRKYKGL